MAARFGWRASIVPLLVLLLAVAAGVAWAAADKGLLVGRWYGEVAVSGSYGGKAFDFRRWVTKKSADGTGLTTMRYYLGTQYQTETVEAYKWGVTGDIYWEDCVSVKDDAGTRSCASRTEYTITRLTDREFQNASKRSGIAYREIKVPEEFKLP